MQTLGKSADKCGLSGAEAAVKRNDAAWRQAGRQRSAASSVSRSLCVIMTISPPPHIFLQVYHQK
jgi:hypothetical protein